MSSGPGRWVQVVGFRPSGSGVVRRTVGAGEQLTTVPARWATEEFAELVTKNCTLAIGGSATMQLFAADAAIPATNRSVIIEFIVDDVDREFERVRALGDVVQEPTTMPWGNRSALVRDPDGNLINLFAPMTPAAAARFQTS